METKYVRGRQTKKKEYIKSTNRNSKKYVAQNKQKR